MGYKRGLKEGVQEESWGSQEGPVGEVASRLKLETREEAPEEGAGIEREGQDQGEEQPAIP